MMRTTRLNSIPDRSSPGSTRTAPPVAHQGVRGEKCATDEGKKRTIRARKNTTIGTWNVRTLRTTGKAEELAHEMGNYEWHVIGLCEVRWKNMGETSTQDGHKIYFSGREDKHEQGVGFLVNKDVRNSVMSCQPISSRIITIRLKASPLNISIIQAYAPTSDYSDEAIEDFYSQLQDVLARVPKKDFVIVQGDWNAKIGSDAYKDWGGVCGPYANTDTNERGERLLEFASLNGLVVTNTLGPHKHSRRTTWHSPSGEHHNQIDYIMVKRRYRSSVNFNRTRSFPGADIGSDHDLVMMTFNIRLKKTKKDDNVRIKFDLDKLKDPEVAESFQAKLGGKFAPLLVIDQDIQELTEQFNSAVVDTAKEVLGKHRPTKKPWVTTDILQKCDMRRERKKYKDNSPEEKEDYRKINKDIKNDMKKAKEGWISDKCSDIETNLAKNNSKKAYQLVKELSSANHHRSSVIQDKKGECLTEEKDILKRWTEYCSELYNYNTRGDPEFATSQESTDTESNGILRSEVEEAVKMLKKGKSAGVDNIPGELVQAGGEDMISVLHKICNKIWETGIWPKEWTQSLIITLPKKGNLQQCQNYRTISLICHPSKVMLRVILNRLRPHAERIIAEEQAGFRKGRSTTEQICNLRILCEKYLEHQQDLYHVFIDFKKAFDRVWHKALWATMKLYNINSNLIQVIEQLYNKATSAVYHNNSIGDWFRTSVGVRQGCLLSPTLFNIFLERIMETALEHHEGTVSIGGRRITNFRFADDIDGVGGSEEELSHLVKCLDETCEAAGMEISGGKTKVMTNKKGGFSKGVEVQGTTLEEVKSFKYLGSIISDQGSKPEIINRIAQAIAALSKLQVIWKDKNIALRSKIRLMRALVISIFLYACESWTLNKDLEKRIQAFEMRCFRKLLGITYRDRVTNEEVRSRIIQAAGPYDELLSIVRRRKLKWFGHVTRGASLAKIVLQGTVPGGRGRGRPRRTWGADLRDWTGMSGDQLLRAARDRTAWRQLACSASLVPLRPPRLRESK